MIQTELGRVTVRSALQQPREKEKIVIHGEQKEVDIQQGWLKKLASAQDHYRQHVKQVMSIAALTMQWEDMQGKQGLLDPMTGQRRSVAQQKKELEIIQSKQKGMRDGSMPVPLSQLARTAKVQKMEPGAVKHKFKLFKRSKKCGCLKERYFDIDSGRLNEYKRHWDHAKVYHVYELKDVKMYLYENERLTPNKTEKFPGHYKDRVMILCKERPQGPLFLYADYKEGQADKSAAQAKNWERAVRMSKYLASPRDKEAMASVVGKAAGNQLCKGWYALVSYWKEMVTLENAVKTFASRLRHSNISRGMHKAIMVWQNRKQKEATQEEQRRFAAEFLAEKMMSLGHQGARDPRLVRNSMMTQIQNKFRHYRQEKIFDMAYSLGSGGSSRLQQAQKGEPMECAIESISSDEAMHLLLDDQTYPLAVTNPEVFQTKKCTYSEVNMPLRLSRIAVSDSLNMLTVSAMAVGFEHSHLAMANWSHFVNIDQISSVVLHTERKMAYSVHGHHELEKGAKTGPFLTIHGPRVCWCRRLDTHKDKETEKLVNEPMGAEDGFALSTKLASGQAVRTFKLAVSVKGSYIPNLSDGEVGPDPSSWTTYMSLHILGRQFLSSVQTGTDPVYPGTFEADVPITADFDALAALDMADVCVEIIEHREAWEPPATVWAGRLPLWKVFAPEEAHRFTDDVRHAVVDPVAEVVTSLKETCGTGSAHVTKHIDLVHPSEKMATQKATAWIELEVTGMLQENQDLSSRPISPELQGCGFVPSLYTTHRGLWYNPKLGLEKFNVNHIASFVEIKIDSLSFPSKDVQNASTLSKYYIEARCAGVCVSSVPLCRPRQNWDKIIPVELGKIDFHGEQIFLPLPPGYWQAHGDKPLTPIELVVVRSPVYDSPSMSWRDLLNAHGHPRQALALAEPAYHCNLIIDGLSVDQCKASVGGLLSSAGSPKTDVRLATNEYGEGENTAILLMDITLRDREYVRMHTIDVSTAQRSIFVGDSAMLCIEEALMFPDNEIEARRRSIQWNPGQRGGKWKAELRDPSMSHEYYSSGLASLPQPPPFKQRFIPKSAEDVIPYKFVMAPSEKAFISEGRPGVFWRVMDDLLAKPQPAAQPQGGGGPFGRGGSSQAQKLPPMIVTHLTHLVKKIPVTVVAVYANKMCDVEINASWLHEWEAHPEKQHTIPGTVSISEFNASSLPPGSGEVPNAKRILLKGVPLGSLMAVHSAGFNVYDAAMSSTSEVMKLHPTMFKNNYNPRFMEAQTFFGTASDKRGGYKVLAGPLPTDTSSCCQYEWSVHLHAKSEDDMLHFVTMLKQCVRMDHFQQMVKMREALTKGSSVNSSLYHVGPPRTALSGYLEVVLVEARRLQAKRVMRPKNAQERVAIAMEHDLASFVVFKVSNEGHPHRYHEGHALEDGQGIRVEAGIWERSEDNFFTIDLASSSGATPVRLEAYPDGKPDSQGVPDPRNKIIVSGWGASADRPAKGPMTSAEWPFGTQRHTIQIDFILMSGTFECWINGIRHSDLDIPSCLARGDAVTSIETSDNLEEVQRILIPKREYLSYKGSQIQQSPIIGHTSSPNWAKLDQLHASGGWVFKTPPLDVSASPKLAMEMTVIHKGVGGVSWPLGIVTLPIGGGASESGMEADNLCDPAFPFKNLWLPLADVKSHHMDTKVAGEIHIMTRYVANNAQMFSLRPQPKSARAFFMQELRSKCNGSTFREPVYDIQARLHGYNPNCWHDSWPASRAEMLTVHAEELENSIPFLKCCEERQIQMWRQYEMELHDGGVDLEMSLGAYRAGLLQSFDPLQQEKVHDLDELLRRGVPPKWRCSNTVRIWSEITEALDVERAYVDKILDPNDRDRPELVYMALVNFGRPIKSDAMLQLQEDMVSAASWENAYFPELMDKHLERLRRAQNICIALIAFSYKDATQGMVDVDIVERQDMRMNMRGSQQHKGLVTKNKVKVPNYKIMADGYSEFQPLPVIYCESLLHIAFMLLLPQVDPQRDRGKHIHHHEEQMKHEIDSFGADRKSFCAYIAKTQSGRNLGDTPHHGTAEEQEESRIFWLLYTLIGSERNQHFRDYFSLPDRQFERLNPWAGLEGMGALGGGFAQAEIYDRGMEHQPMADHSGAMYDIFMLNCILIHKDRDLSIHLGAQGLHLSTVFYGAFMRWYAFYLPTATVFRLWDLIFSESTRHERRRGVESHESTRLKPQRHVLINLAFAVLKACRPKLMRSDSALESKDCLISYMENIYDPSSVIEMIHEVEFDIWDNLVNDGVRSIKLKPWFLTDYALAVETEGWYQKFYVLQWCQNKAIDSLIRDKGAYIDLDLAARAGGMRDNNMPPPMAAGARNAKSDRRLTTKNVVQHVMTPLLKLLETTGAGHDRRYCGMWRRTPKHIAEHGPETDNSLASRVIGFFKQNVLERVVHEDMIRIKPQNLPAIQGNNGEPTVMTKVEFNRLVDRAVPSMRSKADELFTAFYKPPDDVDPEGRMSLNEFFLALICCSRGTVGEKALALFSLFAHHERQMKMHHMVPVMHHTTAVVEKVEGSQEKDKQMLFAPPPDREVSKTIALHFTIHGYSPYAKGHDEILGDVYIPSVHPFITSGMIGAQASNFTIWGKNRGPPPGLRANVNQNPGALGGWGEDKVRPSVGQMVASIKWMPADQPQIGQLGIYVKAIRFERTAIDNPEKKNPWIEVCTYNEGNQPVQIQRWDPRTAMRKGLNVLTAGIKYGGAYKGHMEWGETMRRDPTGYYLTSRDHTERHHGWNNESGEWQWGRKWGEQFSVEGFMIRKDFAMTTGAKTNSISIQACRIIALNIMRRALYPVNNRQALAIADAVFNRCGAVPGILDAVIIQGERVPEEYKTPRELMADYDQKGTAYMNVKQHLSLEFDKQINDNLGALALWKNAEPSGQITLSSLSIKDPFPFMSKVLWLRYVRAGDGERFQVQIPCHGTGQLQTPSIAMDLNHEEGYGADARKAQAQMSITKEEFVACIQQSPLMSESLRMLSLRPSVEQPLSDYPAGKPIVLDVTITDPQKRYEDDDMFDVMNVRQGIIFEVWDHDSFSRDDFLGECWLPALGTLNKTPKRLVLPIRNMQTGSGISTRPDPHKELPVGVMCTGDLHVEASWTIPIEEPPPADETDSTEQRVKREELLHTGKLYLKILKAENLRSGDSGVGRKSKRSADPYTIAYCVNEANGKWRTHHSTGLLDPILKTSVQKNTLNPKWDEKKEVTLYTGGFEQRIWNYRHHHMHMTKRGAQKEKDEYHMAVLGDHEELRIYFGDESKTRAGERGARHGVEVFLGDTVRQFKRKLVEACRKEAIAEARSFDQAMAQRRTDEAEKLKASEAKYNMVNMTFKSVVTVFVPSEKLRSLFNQGRHTAYEYKRLFKLEEQDPAYWQPLDPIRTFSHYSNAYGFGVQISGLEYRDSTRDKDPAIRLRIAEVTGDYKLRNHRYRKFEEDINKGTLRPEDEDTEEHCFGYGLYTHEHDGGSTEWRPVIVERPEATGDIEKRSFDASWLYCMQEVPNPQLDEEQVLLAPHNPKFFGSGSLEHQEFLNQAPDLRREGLTDHDIAVKLNEKLKAKFDLTKHAHEQDGDSLTTPPPITVSEVKHHLMKLDLEGQGVDGDKGNQQQLMTPGPQGGQLPAAGQPAPAAPPPMGGPPQTQSSFFTPGGGSAGAPMRSGTDMGYGGGAPMRGGTDMPSGRGGVLRG